MFDKIIIIQIIQNMGKQITLQKDNQNASCQKQMQQEIFHQSQEISTGPNIFKTKQPNLKNQKKIIKKDEKVKKQRKKRVFQPQFRFQEIHKKKFYLFPFVFATNCPFFKISWQSWKPNKYFVKMAQFFDIPTQDLSKKTTLQCKSFDQRQKMKVYNNVDLLQAAYLFLQNSGMDIETKAILESYLQKIDQKSQYMSFLESYDINDKKQIQLVGQQQQSLQIDQHSNKDESIHANQYPNGVFNEFFDVQESNQHYFAQV